MAEHLLDEVATGGRGRDGGDYRWVKITPSL